MFKRKMLSIACLTCLLCMGAWGAAHAAEEPGHIFGLESAAYRDQDWTGRLNFMKELTARLRSNNCPVSLTPEDLMRKADIHILQQWDPELADSGMGLRICEMLQLDFAKCVEGQ